MRILLHGRSLLCRQLSHWRHGVLSMQTQEQSWRDCTCSVPVPRMLSRSSSSSSSSSSTAGPYIEDWFQSIVKDADFYAFQAEADDKKRRCYFYNIDLQGRLFLEETFPKNIATSIKDERFLDFFFQRVQPVVSDGAKQPYLDVMHNRQIPVDDYPYVSLCGKELNFIRPAACPLVFHTLTNEKELVYGGTLQQAFDWRHLAVSEVTGRIYHAKSENKDNKGIPYGLIRSQLAVSLVERMQIMPDENGQDVLGFYSDESGTWHSVPWLPTDAEPGPWAMPWEYE